MKKLLFCCIISLQLVMANAQTAIPHLQKQGTATQLMVQGKPLLMLCGELHNSSTSDFAYMRPIWQQMKATNLNTVVAAVSWELVEKQKGVFDFSLVDSTVYGARQQGLHLILIWFASWKNGASTYMPTWVKTDTDHFPRVKNAAGQSLEVLSTFSDASADADAAAFKALMKHVRDIDAQQQTVVMVQVENEVGVLNSARDYSAAANNAFSGAIPKQVADYLSSNKNKLTPELYNAWKAGGFKTSGTWEEVFGRSGFNPDNRVSLSFYTEELFMAYYYARYIERVARAGKGAYSLPMFVNAWLSQPGYSYPGK